MYKTKPPRIVGVRQIWLEATYPHNIGECHGFADLNPELLTWDTPGEVKTPGDKNIQKLFNQY
jgi:hypothetical protein